MRARAALALVVAGEAFAVGLLAVGVPRTPPVDWGDPAGWLTATDPATATLALGRVVALVVAAWLLLSTVLACAARIVAAAARLPRVLRVLAAAGERMAPGAVVHLVGAALTVGVVTAVVAPAGAASGGNGTRPAPVAAAARPLVAPVGPVRDGRARDAAAAPTAVPPPTPTPPTATAPTPTAPTPTAPTAPALPAEPVPNGPTPGPGSAAAAPVDRSRHRVVPGEHLWGIAEAALRARGVTDDPGAVARYWRTLCDENRAHLRSGDPNVIEPGEEIDLPPVA